MKKIFAFIGIVLGVLIIIVLVNTFRFTSTQPSVQPTKLPQVNSEQFAEHLAGALEIPTVSYQDSALFDPIPFNRFHQYLQQTFPNLHRALKKEVINQFALLYTWVGRNERLKPILLMAHMDVVPIEPGTEEKWEYPPFAGEIADGYIWGRGAMDDKSSMLAILDAVEYLVTNNFQPERTVYLAFGYDEEIGGAKGAAKIVEYLKKRGVRLSYVLDEGGVVIQGMMPGIQQPVAMIGVAEKGYVSVEFVVESEGGHSSMPPKETAVGILSKAIYRLEKNQMPASINGPVREMFHYLGPEMPFAKKMVMANLWLFDRFLARQLTAKPTTNAMVRTTTAPTMLEGSVKENVLPSRVRGVVNFRIRPGDTIKSVLEHIRKVIQDSRVRIQVLNFGSNPSPVSNVNAEDFKLLGKTIREVFPGSLVSPSLVIGATDSRHYVPLAQNVYRFVPLIFKQDDLHRVHGTNERVSIDNYSQAVKFYIRLIRNSNKAGGEKSS